MTKTLTEQWREGKLPNGDYYIKVRGNLTKKDFFTYDNCINGKWAYTLDGNLIDIIEKVPSYDKYRGLVSKTDKLEKRLEIATKALEELEIKSDKLYRGGNDWSLVEQLDFIKAKCQETLYYLKEMEGVK